MGGTGTEGAPARAEGVGADDWDDDGEDADHDGPTEADLKERWQLDQRLVAWLKAQGLEDDHPRRIQAERVAEESKRAWQETRPKAAASSRMRWAEEALLKAKKGMAKAEQSIDDLDRWYEEEREARHATLREYREKVKMREDHLASVVREAAEHCVPEPQLAPQGEVLQATFDTLGQGIGPALEQIRESVPEGSPIQLQINAALAAVANLHGALGNAVAAQQQRQQHLAHHQRQHQHGQSWTSGWDTGVDSYHIGDDWHVDGGGWRHREQDQASGQAWGHDGWGGTQEWSDEDWECQRAQQFWNRGQHGAAAAHGAAHGHQADEGDLMDTRDVRGPKWMRRAAETQGDNADRTGKKGRTSEGTAEPAQDPEAAAAGGAAGGSGGGERAESEATAARREEILKQANKDGIDTTGLPTADGGIEAIEAWARDNLI